MALTTTKQRRAIGERLAQERRRLNYTELQIAQLLGVQLEVYLQYESGEDDPGIFGMQRLYSIGFDVMFIITGDRYRPVPGRKRAFEPLPRVIAARQNVRLHDA